MTYQLASNPRSNPLPTPSNGVFLPTPYTPPRVGTPNPGLEDPGGVPSQKPANDNREPRQVQNWPTGKRLLQSGRHEDHAMLVAYRSLVDMAFHDPEHEGWRDPAPARGQTDSRAMEERIGQRDMILDEDSIKPSIEEMRDLSGIGWGDDADPSEYRAALATWIDTAGIRLHTIGGLEFHGSLLMRYGDPDDDSRWDRKPAELRRPHRAPLSDPSIAPSTGGWSIENQIAAREKVQAIWDQLPASSVRILEHAIGSTKAREIGEAFGKVGKTAERFGVRLIDRAIDHLRQAVPRLHPAHV